MAIHSITLAWKIPWMEESGRLQSMGSQRIGHTEQLYFVTGTPAENLEAQKEKIFLTNVKIINILFYCSAYVTIDESY